jgi:hypothetical protein
VQALFAKVVTAKDRVFHGHFPSWGLPGSHRDWRALIAGRPFAPIDTSLPLLAAMTSPHEPLRAHDLAVGARIIHRVFGPGTITALDAQTFTATFDEDRPAIFSKSLAR